MRKTTVFVFLISSILLASCAGMRVKADIMDPEYFRGVQAEIQNAKLFRKASQGDTSPVAVTIEDICSIYYETTIGLYETAIQAQPAETKDQKFLTSRTVKLQRNAQDKLNNIISDEGKNVCLGDLGFSEDYKVTDLYQQFLSLNCNTKECEKDPLKRTSEMGSRMERYLSSINSVRLKASANLVAKKSAALDLVRNNNAIPSDVKRTASKDINTTIISGKKAVERVPASLENNGYLGSDGRTLVLSDVAYAAANAPEEVWEKDYNVAKGIGIGGSLDTVIKLNSTADFSVKGLVFDARSTALTARKMTVSTLQLLAAGSGLPIQTITSASTDANGNVTQEKGEVIDDNTQIITAKTEIETDKQLDIYYRAALKQVAATTISTAETINSPGAASAAIKDARAANKSAFETNKTFIEALNEGN